VIINNYYYFPYNVNEGVSKPDYLSMVNLQLLAK